MSFETVDGRLPWEQSLGRRVLAVPHLVLAWSLDEPDRVGEAIPVERRVCLGRGDALADDPAPRARLVRMRPGVTEPRPPIANARISRVQTILTPRGDEVHLEAVGRAAMRLNGRAFTQAVARAGDVIEIHNAAVFVIVARPPVLPEDVADLGSRFEFGRPDPFGLVGESDVIWRLRSALAFAALSDRHVLLLGPSGAGKELAAKAIHGLSDRRARSLVARNAATMPESLLDAELFGNVKNYPNPGMVERPGLVGEADGSTLFLDEIGDLPESHQVHLLRVLDAGGEYQRLGDSKVRRSSFRLVAATNRPLDALKHDFLARFTHRIEIPGLDARADDVPLVLAEILKRTALSNPLVAERLFERRRGMIAEPKLAPGLVARLLRHPFTHHVRELERLVWLAIGDASAEHIGLNPAVEAELAASEESSSIAPTDVDKETLVRALAENGRSPSKAARALGLKNRYVLLRLLKKHGVSVGTDEGEGT